MARHCAWRHLHICIFIHSWNFWWGRRSRCSFNLFQYFIEHTFVGKITLNKILFNAGCSTCIRMTLEGIFVQSKFTKSKNEKAWILKQQQQRGLNTWPKWNLLGPHQDNQADCSWLTSTPWQKEIQGHHKKQPLSRPNPSYTDFLRREWLILNRIGHSAGQHSQVGASAKSPCIWRGTNNGPQACPHNSLKQD